MTALQAFAETVGSDPKDPVVAAGGKTQWMLGGLPDRSAREVNAPSGVVDHLPEEMIVRVRAGTTVADLSSILAEKGQLVALDPAQPDRATVGGVLAAGQSGVRRLRWGPIRDMLLEAIFVAYDGRIVKAGAPLVKNVTGFDLCRTLVGSLGTLGLLAEVVLRVQPLPRVSQWFSGVVADPHDLVSRLYRPSSILWDGTTTSVLLEGHQADVEAQAGVLAPAFSPADGPPPLPSGGRRSIRPKEVMTTTEQMAPETFLAEIGVGIIHLHEAEPPRTVEPGAGAIGERLKNHFDPGGRFAPGRRLWADN